MDDFRQSSVVAKNEIRKFIRGKRFTLYVVLTIFVFALITALPYILGYDPTEIPGGAVAIHLMFVPFLVIIAATLFSSVAIVSEFEERTALILFTRPIKKTSIFIGKIVGCIILETAMLVLFYIGMIVLAAFHEGAVSSGLFVSLGVAFAYIVSTTCIAIFISSIMKKGSTSAILTFFILGMILSIISAAIMVSADIDPWFMLDIASNAITPADMTSEFMYVPDALTAVGTMIGWSIPSIILGWLMFIRREF
jgi:ABC-2 type transport system permease protein